MEISRDKFYVYCVYFASSPADRLDFEEAALPEKSLQEFANRKQQIIRRIAEIEAFIKANVGMEKALLLYKESLKKRLEFLNVKFGMKTEGKFACLQGFSYQNRYPKTAKNRPKTTLKPP